MDIGLDRADRLDGLQKRCGGADRRLADLVGLTACHIDLLDDLVSGGDARFQRAHEVPTAAVALTAHLVAQSQNFLRILAEACDGLYDITGIPLKVSAHLS